MTYIPSQTIPLSSFGELSTAANHPVIQANAVYGLGSKMRTSVSGAGASAGALNSEFYASSGTTSTGVASVFTKKAAVYKSGQGLSMPFTARFGAPQANSITLAGPSNGTDGVNVGYNGTVFGAFFRNNGKHEIRTLTITTPSSGATNATITINSVAYIVPLTAGTTQKNAGEIAASLTLHTTLFTFSQVDNTVIMRTSSARVAAGTYSFSHATAAGSFTTKSTGVATTETFVAATDFSEGNALLWLDPSKGNVYRVDVQYLGYGDVDLYAEIPDTKEYRLIHRFHRANLNTSVNFTNPSFRLQWTASNRGSTTSVSCYGGSGAAFNQGELVIGEQPRSITGSKTNSTETVLFMVRVLDILDGKVNISASALLDISVTTESSKGCTFKVILNPTVATGTVSWQYIESGLTPLVVDTGATTLMANTGRTIKAIQVGNSGSASYTFPAGVDLFPQDFIAITAAVTSGAASLNTASITMQDDL